MPPPTPIYVVKFNSKTLPGYAQVEDTSFSTRLPVGEALNRVGGYIGTGSPALRPIRVTMRVLSRLSASASGLSHLNDCRDQLRTAYSYMARTDGVQALQLGDSDRHLLAAFSKFSNIITAADSPMAVNYDADFLAQPYFYDNTALTDTVTSNGTLDITVPWESARVYPVFSIPGAVTACVITDSVTSRTITFNRGSHPASATKIDCARLKVYFSTAGTLISDTVTEVDFGFYFDPYTTPGTDLVYTATVSGFTGSGTITMTITPRYER